MTYIQNNYLIKKNRTRISNKILINNLKPNLMEIILLKSFMNLLPHNNKNNSNNNKVRLKMNLKFC